MTDGRTGTGREGRRGFTLVESVLALSALVLCLAATCNLLTWLGRLSSYTDLSSRANALGQAKVEELLAMGFSNLAAGADVSNGFSRAWTLDGSLGAQLKLLTVDISWTNVGGKVSTVTAKGACLR